MEALSAEFFKRKEVKRAHYQYPDSSAAGNNDSPK